MGVLRYYSSQMDLQMKKRLEQKIYVALFEQIFSTKIRSRMNIKTEDLLEDRKITTVIKLFNLKII